MNKKITIGCDHAGLELKNDIKDYLKSLGYDVIDIGTHTKESCDYPLIAKELCQHIKDNSCGILICGTGIGMSIAANKEKGIRAAVVSDTCSAKFPRQHNNSNVLCLGARIIGQELAKDIVKIWLETDFQAERHQRRIDMFE